MGRGLPAAATWHSPVGSALPTEGAVLRPRTGGFVNNGGRTQGDNTCNSALCPTRPSKKFRVAPRDGDLRSATRHGQENHSVCALSFKTRGSFGKLLRSLSLLILKMGMMISNGPLASTPRFTRVCDKGQ
ncbi:hypothetical protein mRhiFer1_009835 [Rhinolophus ferrumequinum]|uniref:Uncharacterized protein n=1 Tax=Rhinolophus ferrumequinum TaxID=59479 RepID=A0A7J7YTA7_RHIFE|nr:hypothetical protein mRhiFer1_009835 [Rhinolophus ferrumequinum]